MDVAIDRVDNIGVEDLRREYADRNRPVIIKGCIDHWPARKKWDLDYFANRFGDKRVHFSGRDWTVGEFANELRSGKKPTPYLNQVKLDEQFPELYADIGELAYTSRGRNLLESPFLPWPMRVPRGIKAVFIGGEGSGFGKLHWDYSYLHVYISQVKGSKDFMIFAPSDGPFLYPNPEYVADSLIKDINNFDIEAYPDIKKATPIRFTVQEGETVFVPAGWWHSTKMRELSISLAESSLDGGNWGIRHDWFMAEYRREGVAPWKRMALDAYVRAMGLFVR